MNRIGLVVIMSGMLMIVMASPAAASAPVNAGGDDLRPKSFAITRTPPIRTVNKPMGIPVQVKPGPRKLKMPTVARVVNKPRRPVAVRPSGAAPSSKTVHDVFQATPVARSHPFYNYLGAAPAK